MRGGGFVKSLIDQDCLAVGIEGSDYSKIRKRAEWVTIPEYLFTADITEPFQLLEINENGNENFMKFDVITAWEVLEHIAEEKLPAVFENISRYLLPQGIVVLSITTIGDIINGIQLHQTIKPKEWWMNKFSELGFIHHNNTLCYFGRDDWVRGTTNVSFNVILTRLNEDLPYKNRLKIFTILFFLPNIFIRIIRRGINIMKSITPKFVKNKLKNFIKKYKGL